MVVPDASASPRRRLTREDWVTAALAALGEGGVAAVAVEPLATRLGTTKGSFYWHFPSREALLEAALAAWEQATTTAVLADVERSTVDPVEQLRLLIARVIDNAERDPVEPALFASAAAPVVGQALTRVTAHRIDGTTRIFARMGLPAPEARRRALLAYSLYLGYGQLLRATPAVLPQTRSGRREYLDHVLHALTADLT
jgi:AcrR family transcriptional regulator